MKNFYIIFLAFLQIGYSQSLDLKRANQYFAKTQYSAAIPFFEKVIVNDSTFEISQKLADCYYYTNNYEKAYGLYSLLVNLPGLDEDFHFKYNHILKANGKPAEATQILKQYYLSINNSGKLNDLAKQIKHLKNVTAIGQRFEINNLALNTPKSEFGGVVFGSDLVYAAVKSKPSLLDKTYKWSNESYLNLVKVPLKNIYQKDSLTNLFSRKVKTSLHESNAVFTKDGKTMYFTRNTPRSEISNKNTNKVATVQIFRAELIGNKWSNIKSLPFNSANYSVEHPALSSDEQTLYFASDMPGSLGSFDIYSVSIIGTSFGAPHNLGPNINTAAREQFPFASKDNKLYFSSNRLDGFGGLDVYVSTIEGNALSLPANVGLPLNSAYDDFAFYINSDTKEGFFSSNRAGGKGNDDIYSLKETKDLDIQDCKQLVSGVITDVDAHLPLEAAFVILKNGTNEEIARVNTSALGQFSFSVDCESNYTVLTSKENYTEKSRKFTISDERGKANDASMEVRSVEVIQKEMQLALEKKQAEELLLQERRKTTEIEALEKKRIADALALNQKKIAEALALKQKQIAETKAAEQKKRDDAAYLEAKRLADIAAAELQKKAKLETEKKNKDIAEAARKEKVATIIAKEKDVIKEKDRLIIKTDPIYFDYNMWYIRKESQKILNRVVELMNKYPEMVVEIGSHTDNRGNSKFNQDLSQKRADASRDYIIGNSIPKSRVISKGYGESVQISKCIPEDSCTEEQHELNRRSEFVIKDL